MLGPGKYDELCSMVREQTNALGVVLIVMAGDKGGGFSCQGPPSLTLALPEMLEELARQIRADRAKLGH